MIQLSLNTPAERAAALRALTVYVNALDALSTSGGITPNAHAPSILAESGEYSRAEADLSGIESRISTYQQGAAGYSLPTGATTGRHAPAIPAVDVPDVGAPLPPLPVAVSAPDLTAEQVFGTAPMTAQQAADALNGQHAAPVALAVELDAEGKPWDPELHASSKAKIGDGTWRKKRNAAPAVPTPPVVPAAPAVPTPPAVPTTPVVAAVTVPELTQALMAAMMAQKIDGLAINALCQRHGVPNIVALSQHADKATAIMADFRATVPV